MRTEYKGFKIEYSESNDSWGADNGETELVEKEGLTALKRRIDKELKKENTAKGIRVLCFTGWGNTSVDKLKECVVTSITDSGEVWVKIEENGSRQKQSDYNAVYLNNDENAALFEKAKDKRALIDSLEGEIKELGERMAKLDRGVK